MTAGKYLAACDKCGYRRNCRTQDAAVTALRAHKCQATPVKPYVPARERTPWGQFQLRPSHLTTERPGAAKYAPKPEPEQARTVLPDARPAPKHKPAIVGRCHVCYRPMRRKGDPPADGTVKAQNATLCNSCYVRQGRGLEGPAATRGDDTDALPRGPHAFPPRDVLEEALCAQTDPEVFFPEKGGSTAPAKRVCAACDVREKCLEWALANNERFGIYGGLSERERRALRTQRGTAA